MDIRVFLLYLKRAVTREGFKMTKAYTGTSLFIILCCIALNCDSYEISGSPYATGGAPIPSQITPPNEKLIVVDPVNHAWGAYHANGKLIRWGMVTAGANWCADLHRSCRTKSGSFRIYLLGDSNCVSYKFPIEDGGGAPMPYCMYFNGSEALHGSNDISYGNSSHGCVRMHVDDAKWLRFQFVEAPADYNHYQGTRVIIKPY